MQPIKYLVQIFTITVACVAGSSCKKLVDVPAPDTSLTGSTVYTTDQTATSVVTGIYTSMSEGSFATGINSISLLCGLSADELQGIPSLMGPSLTQFYTNSLNNQSSTFWGPFFNYINTANTAIQGISASSDLTPAVKAQLLGECKFMRALAYFYLVNLYGDVPLITSGTYTDNLTLDRTPQQQVWAQIFADLADAQNLLNSNFVDGTLLNTTIERVRPTKWAALSLLSRAYLYQQKWDSAVIASTAVINQSSLFSLVGVDSVFLENSAEAIWQIPPVNSNINTYDGSTFIIVGEPVSTPYLSSYILNAFEPGDFRRMNWVDSFPGVATTYYYPYKYKVQYSTTVSEYLMILRLGEQYLVRAEAEANGGGGGIPAAIGDLNIIRGRAGLAPYAGAIDQTSLLAAILHERQVELFTEWGHRWLDLKRTATVDSVMSPICSQKGGSWKPDWQLYPLPLYDLQTDTRLVQNPGY